MKRPIGAAVLVAITLTAAACAGVHRTKVASGSFRSGSHTKERTPTKYSCAATWNRSVPSSGLLWDRRHHVWQATVQEGTANELTVTFGNGQTTTTPPREVETCTIVLFAQRGNAMLLSGVWQHGTISSWGHPYRKSLSPGSGNACVARDGTIDAIGPFTASSRCPHHA